MREHDLELIAALVEGRLDDDSEARALIDSSPELREEYEAQRLAFEAMRDAGTANLRKEERASLHRDVWTQLRAGSGESTSRAPWYYRWAPVAAGLLVVVGLVSVLAQGGADSGGEGAFDLAAESAATTAAASEAAEGGAAAPGDGDDTAMTDSTSTEEGGSDRAASPEEVEFYSAQADQVRTGEYTDTRLEAFEYEEGADDHTNCLDRLGLDDHRIAATSSTPDGEPLLVTIAGTDHPTTAPVGFVEPDACELVYLDE